ncbi:PDIA1 [Lepeophtheirus salmonis]|uniref:PDIA1 n=1 Tax=Lepeophtheirus salmonis TaxID=72036 RepID=A0A7R8CKB5_LEPSM|nr:PDIA1 [Lepeophtheirus salmonis]CAF2848115.1 PDIA1 [Lepeophtheirus salmonis]
MFIRERMKQLFPHALVLVLLFLSLSLAKEGEKNESPNMDSDEMSPDYEKLATKLKKSKSKFAIGKLDATVSMTTGQKYRVTGYPTLKFFFKGLPIDYEGARENNKILKFMEKKSGDSTKTFKDETELNKMVERNSLAIIGFFKDLNSKEANIFIETARLTSYVEFLITSDKSLMKKFGFEKYGIMAQNDFPENTGKDISVKRSTYKGKFNRNDIIEWSKSKSVPLIVEFNDQTSQKIMTDEKINQHVIVFAKFTGKDALSKEDRDKLMIEFARAAEKYRNKFIFVYVDLGDVQNGPMFHYFGGDIEKTPFFIIFNLADVSKFHPHEDANTLTTKNLVKFIDLYLNKKAKQFFLSGELPDDWDSKPLKYIVQKNFMEITHDKKKDAMILYISNECEQCGDKMTMMKELAQEFKDSDDKVLAYINGGINEFKDESLTTDLFPTIRIFKKKTNEMVEFLGQFSVDNLRKFLIEYDVQKPEYVETDDEEELEEDNNEESSIHTEL